MPAHRTFSRFNNMDALNILPQEIWSIVIRNNKQPLTLIKTKLACKLFNKIITEDEELSKILIKTRKLSRNINGLMFQAAKAGDADLVNLCVSKGADKWAYGLDGAIEAHHDELIKFFRSKGADDWARILEMALSYDHKPLIAEMFSEKKSCTNYDYAGIVHGAAISNNIGVVEMCIRMRYGTWEDALCGAAMGNHKDLIDICIKNGATYWSGALWSAALEGHIELVRFFISKGGNVLHGYMAAAMGGHMSVLELLLAEFGLPNQYELDQIISQAARYGHIDIVKFFVQKGACDFNDALQKAAMGSGDMDVINYLVECGADHFDEDMLDDGHWFKPELAKYFLEKRNGMSLDQYKKEWEQAHPRSVTYGNLFRTNHRNRLTSNT